MTQKIVMLVMANADNNNNKFYELKLEDDERVVARYGRVGVAGVTEEKGSGQDTFDKVLKAKTKKGYKEVKILTTASAPSVTSPAVSNLAEIAKRDIAKNNPTLASLVDKLTKINRHQLLGASGGKIDIINGQVMTPLGLVTLDSIEDAKKKLNELNRYVEKKDLGRDYTSTLEDYLTLVPQKIPAKRGWNEIFFTEFTTFQNQNSLLEQIELSIKTAEPPKVDATPAAEAPAKLFGYSLDELQDDRIFDKINKFYKENINSRHVSRSYKLKRVFILDNPNKYVHFEGKSKNLGNVKRLWHGTRACNVLSILKAGLIIPPQNGNFTISGRMFGNGVYFSDQSSKSLNYATNYWSGGAQEKDELYMIMANVAMGKEYTPRNPCQSMPSGYHSIFAKGGFSGVMNNEMIVFDLDQIHLNYLCEFED